jgi:hypothetical protein
VWEGEEKFDKVGRQRGSASCTINIIYIIAIIYGKSVLKNVNKKNDLNINFFDSLLEKSCIFAAENFKNISE